MDYNQQQQQLMGGGPPPHVIQGPAGMAQPGMYQAAMLGFSPHQEILMGSVMGPAGLSGRPMEQQQQQQEPSVYSSSSIMYGQMDGSRGSLGPSGSHGPPTGSFRRLYAAGSGAYGMDPTLSRSDYAYIGPGPMAAPVTHTVESLLEIIATLPPHQDAAAVVGPGLQHLDSSALAALMKELGRAGMFKRSVELFDFLRRQTSPEYTHLLDIYTYTTSIAVCSASQQLQRALDLMAEMRSRGITCNVHTYSALMNVCIKCNEVGLVQQVYNQMLQEGCTPNLVTYNTLIDLYVKTGQWQEAIKLLDKLEEEVRGCGGRGRGGRHGKRV